MCSAKLSLRRPSCDTVTINATQRMRLVLCEHNEWFRVRLNPETYILLHSPTTYRKHLASQHGTGVTKTIPKFTYAFPITT